MFKAAHQVDREIAFEKRHNISAATELSFTWFSDFSFCFKVISVQY